MDIPLFTYDYFKALMARAMEIAPITTLDGRKDGLCVILRHDIDLDIPLAYEMAMVEEEIGIRSTFFIMTTSHFYNPTSSKNREYLFAMAQKGFEIGLHFDPTIYGNADLEELKVHADRECSILESVIGHNITSISLHNPSVTGKFPMFAPIDRGIAEVYVPPKNFVIFKTKLPVVAFTFKK